MKRNVITRGKTRKIVALTLAAAMLLGTGGTAVFAEEAFTEEVFAEEVFADDIGIDNDCFENEEASLFTMEESPDLIGDLIEDEFAEGVEDESDIVAGFVEEDEDAQVLPDDGPSGTAARTSRCRL